MNQCMVGVTYARCKGTLYFVFFNQLTFWPCRVFAAVCGLSLVVVGQGLQARGLQESRLMGSAAQALKLWLVDFSCSLH